MKIIFMGTPDLSAHVMKELYSKHKDIICAVTQPDRPAGRGRKLKQSPLKQLANKLCIPVIQGEHFNKELFEQIKKTGKADIGVVVAYGLYIPSYVLDYPEHGLLNIHFSLLPRYRGAAPVARAIMNGDTKTGVSIMRLSKAMDEGDVLSQAERLIEDDDNSLSLSQKLAADGARLLIETIDKIKLGTINATAQSNMGEASYAPKISSEERIIDWSASARDIHNRVRALYPWPCVQVELDGMLIKLIKTSIKNENLVFDTPGTVIDVNKKKGFIELSTSSGSLLLEKVQVSGKKEMLVNEFLNGYDIKIGKRFI